jgi:hypothetical protein
MRSLAAGLTASVLALVTLTGCADATEKYCGALERDRKEIADMIGSGSPSALLSNLSLFRELADQAPEDLRDEWQTFITALDGLEDAIKDAGVRPSDFKDGKAPAELSEAERKAIADAAGQIGTDDVVAASTGIEQQARDVCKVNLGL